MCATKVIAKHLRVDRLNRHACYLFMKFALKKFRENKI